MDNKLNNRSFFLDYQYRSETNAETEHIESIKSTTNLLLQKIEALEKDLPSVSVDSFKKGSNLYEIITAFEKKIIKNALKETNWNQTRAAQILGVKLTTLNAKIKRYELYTKSFSSSSVE